MPRIPPATRALRLRHRAATLALRLIPNIRYGTEPYPEKVARRLRATNIAAWIGAAWVAFFAVRRFMEGKPHWKYAALAAVAYAAIPLLHRFGRLAAPLALIAIAYTWIFWLTWHGAADSSYTYYTAGALGILLIGSEQVVFSIVVGALAAGLIVFLHIAVPHGAGEIGRETYYRALVTFIINVLGSSAVVYLIVFYAVRQYTRAEEKAEHEHQRSESLLLNILPSRVAERLGRGRGEYW
jgi:adenylate cyclase